MFPSVIKLFKNLITTIENPNFIGSLLSNEILKLSMCLKHPGLIDSTINSLCTQNKQWMYIYFRQQTWMSKSEFNVSLV